MFQGGETPLQGIWESSILSASIKFKDDNTSPHHLFFLIDSLQFSV